MDQCSVRVSASQSALNAVGGQLSKLSNTFRLANALEAGRMRTVKAVDVVA